MASVFLKKYKDKKTGEIKERQTYTIKFKNQHGHQQVTSGCKDERMSWAFAEKLEEDALRISQGLTPKYPEYTGRVLGCGLAAARTKPLLEVLEEYLRYLTRRKPKAFKHRKDVQTIMARMVKECAWSVLADIQPVRFEKFLCDLSDLGRAPRTQNRQLEVLRSFLNWCVTQKYLAINPIAGVKAIMIGETGRKRLRQAFLDSEWQGLLAVAPPHRRMVYAVALFSGFRRGELSRMTKEDCTPIGPHPRWHVDASRTKNGRSVKLPMAPECAEALRPHWCKLQPGDLLFKYLVRDPVRGQPANIPSLSAFRTDLKKAGIPRQDERDRWVDFHSLRYTFALLLSRTHPIEVVCKMMRHSTIDLTVRVYLDLGLDREQGEGAWTLPPLCPRKDIQNGGLVPPDSPQTE